jgi:phenylacetate-coenzyme A ligase PaaK-like adenylate-forming protein
LVITPTASSW